MEIVTKDNIKVGLRVCILPTSEFFSQQKGFFGVVEEVDIYPLDWESEVRWCRVRFGPYINSYRYGTVSDLYIYEESSTFKNSLSGVVINQ